MVDIALIVKNIHEDPCPDDKNRLHTCFERSDKFCSTQSVGCVSFALSVTFYLAQNLFGEMQVI